MTELEIVSGKNCLNTARMFQGIAVVNVVAQLDTFVLRLSDFEQKAEGFLLVLNAGYMLLHFQCWHH